MRRLALALALGLSPAAPEALAQSDDRLAVVIVYQEQLIEASLAGRALLREEQATAQRLVEERRAIEQSLEAEERALAERRKTLSREEFAALAEAFDAKVKAARDAQVEKAVALQRSVEANRQRFLDGLRPVLSEVMRRFGASVMVEGRTVVQADPSLDVTGDVIALMDERYRQTNLESPLAPESSP
ncbi:MAG: OmpH family outer membrane protein [Pseudomonadota bacterium]